MSLFPWFKSATLLVVLSMFLWACAELEDDTNDAASSTPTQSDIDYEGIEENQIHFEDDQVVSETISMRLTIPETIEIGMGISNSTYEGLRLNGVSETLIAEISALHEQVFFDPVDFLTAVEEVIGSDELNNYKDLILSYSNLTGYTNPYQVFDIYNDYLEVAGCTTSTSDPIDLLLVEGCLFYHDYYLYPDFLPSSLDGFSTIQTYVAEIKAKDTYTSYFGVQTFSDNNDTFTGIRSYIGISFNKGTEDTYYTITYVDPFSRGWHDGLQVGDAIVGIDGQTLPLDISRDEIIDLLPRSEEEKVTLTIQRGDQTLEIETAAETHIAIKMDDIAYLRLESFTDIAAKEVYLDLAVLESQGTINKYILDLRNNGGGVVTGALELLDLLIEEDSVPLLQVQNASNTFTEYSNRIAYQIGGLNPDNFVVLMNKGSASASEITIAALQDHGVATVIGSNSYGKGVTQIVISLIDNSGLYITYQNLLSPDGRNFHIDGLQPDYVNTATVTSVDNDPALDAAKAWLNGQRDQFQTGRTLTALREPNIQQDWLELSSPTVY